jgi:hypothetical protein
MDGKFLYKSLIAGKHQPKIAHEHLGIQTGRNNAALANNPLGSLCHIKNLFPPDSMLILFVLGF